MFYTEAEKLLNKKELPLPKSIMDKNIKVLEQYQKKVEGTINRYEDSLKNRARVETKEGKRYAVAFNENPQPRTLKEIKKLDIFLQYHSNITDLIKFKKGQKEGSGIIHFNNPQQLVSRLELLAGFIIAGNNGVKQEFSQIAHLLHQLKVINKKTLNNLLKKYILFK